MGKKIEVRSKNKPLQKRLNRRALGISNVIRNPENQKIYSVQFYDVDISIYDVAFYETIQKVLEIFPYDAIAYQTKHGVHIISFALTYGRNLTKARAVEMSKRLGEQDYWTVRKDLCLRISPKWNRFHKLKSPKPLFLEVLREPIVSDLKISGKHLEFYEKYMDLPREVSALYVNAQRRAYPIKTYSYMTRD